MSKYALLQVCLGLLLLGSPPALADAATDRAPARAWREAFQSSPVGSEITSAAKAHEFAERNGIPKFVEDALVPKYFSGTLRYRLILSGGGTEVRVRFYNPVRDKSLTLSGASVAAAAGAFDAVPGSLRRLTFGGQADLTIPPSGIAVSDPVPMRAVAGAALLVSLTGPEAFRIGQRGGNLMAVAPGDQTGSEKMTSGEETQARPLVSGISVLTDARTHVIVAVGDSITDGNREKAGEIHGWPEQLARRLNARKSGGRYQVVNAGIAGNRLLQPGPIAEMGTALLARLDADVLRQEGVSHIILLEGTNDIGLAGRTLFGTSPSVSYEDIIFAYRQVLARAHERGIKVVMGTILPVGGSETHGSPEKDALRQKVNSWIRQSGEPDGVIDFEAALRDPAKPARLRPEYDSGDHLHPSNAGYMAMGDAIALAQFK